jgi:hypothetical protein
VHNGSRKRRPRRSDRRGQQIPRKNRPPQYRRTPRTQVRIDPTIDAALELLCERFPAAFFRYEARRRPLKIGIHLDVLAVLDGAITPAELGRALRVYVLNQAYRRRLVAGATRIDLDGKAAGVVSAEHATPTLARKPAPKPSAPPVKRLGIKDLRAIARARKAGGAP